MNAHQKIESVPNVMKKEETFIIVNFAQKTSVTIVQLKTHMTTKHLIIYQNWDAKTCTKSRKLSNLLLKKFMRKLCMRKLVSVERLTQKNALNVKDVVNTSVTIAQLAP